MAIDDPLPLGVASVSNQGVVSGTNFIDVVTDDPAVAGAIDPTVTTLTVPPSVSATKTSTLVDVDGDGQAGPGDTLLYTIVVANDGTGDAAGVLFDDTPDPYTTLTTGSVTTTAGTVVTGNAAGDATVAVNVGTLAGLGGAATITFEVEIDGPLPVGVTSVSNQGVVSGANFGDLSTDDPAVAGTADPTVTALFSSPEIVATKTAVLELDIDGDGRADADEVIRYVIVVENTGTGDAADVVLSDTPDANTTIVPGSVTTTLGTVTSGNGAGDTTVTVDIGTLTGLGGSATIVFDVRIVDPLPPEVANIVNSATISGSNFADAATDDPSQPGAGDATAFPTSHDVANIPTADEWALILMVALIAMVALRRLGAG